MSMTVERKEIKGRAQTDFFYKKIQLSEVWRRREGKR